MLKLPAIATAVLAGILALYWIAAWSAAERKLAALVPLPDARASYRITLDFPPERFHQLFLQEKGRLVGVHGNVVDMMDVDPAALRAIAGHYWVASVAPWDGR
jgi:hypothetical protein